MKLRHRITLNLIVAIAIVAVGAGLIIYSGVYNVAADKPHSGIGYQLINTLKNRSINARSNDITVPDLEDETLLAAGAEHYTAMCSGCHLAPGKADTELRQGLYPTPPDFTEYTPIDPAAAFWVIKHGVKFTGMPAWGKTHDDRSIWGLVAFMNRLPELSEEDYEALASAAAEHGHHDHDNYNNGSHNNDSDENNHGHDNHRHEAPDNTAPSAHSQNNADTHGSDADTHSHHPGHGGNESHVDRI